MKKGKKNEALELKNQLARALADYDNLRKRTDIEREVWVKFSGERIVSKLLPVLDILESAQKHFKDKGLEFAIADFKKVLYDERLEEIKPLKGEVFNHEVHEAVESVQGGRKGHIADLVLTGWKFVDGPVLRFAKVKVFGERTDKKEELDKEMARKDYM